VATNIDPKLSKGQVRTKTVSPSGTDFFPGLSPL